MPTVSNEDFDEEEHVFSWNQSASTVLTIVIVAFSAIITYWIVS